MTTPAYEERKQRLSEFLQQNRDGRVRLKKATSNLFRDRKNVSSQQLDVGDFKSVLKVDRVAGLIDVEGMTPYAALTAESLKHGLMPCVVPQLKSITIGGAVTGSGIESLSFRYGLVHETIDEIEVLLPDGRTVIGTPTNEQCDLFYGFPNSYGTLGYALRVKVKAIPVKAFVELTHIRHTDAELYFEDLQRWCRSDVDFVDGVIFSRDEMYLTLGRFTDTAPYTSDYTYRHIYYQSIRQRQTDYLTVSDYIWRWDTDWFWCSKNVYAQHPLIRRLYGRDRLNSITYTKIMRWNSRWKLTAAINRVRGVHSESVIQDVELPVEHCVDFFNFYHDTIRFLPVWVCPTRAYRPDVQFDLYRLDPQKLYVNFGFWDVISSRQPAPAGFHNRQIECKVRELGGMKSLYSDSYCTVDEFWQVYNRAAYERLKHKYDPAGRLPDLYEKCVLKE
ncbi:MAG: FAD-binding oxidoreductase [Gammaproteobacteria bacterium]|nr:FAD-binding oxidoreductase [Gammaproteobacteria bacterium]